MAEMSWPATELIDEARRLTLKSDDCAAEGYYRTAYILATQALGVLNIVTGHYELDPKNHGFEQITWRHAESLDALIRHRIAQLSQHATWQQPVAE